jgi:hypothetical protein
MITKRIIIFSIVMFFAVGALTAGTTKDTMQGQILAKAGSLQIYRTDAAYKVGIEKAYGNERVTEVIALVSLINDALEHEAAGMHGVTIKRDEVAAFKRHVDKTSRAPQILAKVKAVFGRDTDSYERLYLGPKIINRKLRYWYSRNAEIHKYQRALIEKAYYLAQSGMSMEAAASECGLELSTIDYGKAKGDMPAILKQYSSASEQLAADPMMKILATMSQGQIYYNIAEDDHGYKVIKLIEKNGQQYKVEAIVVRKHPFGKWFRVQAEKIKVEILDAEMKKTIEENYPNLWWVKEVHNETHE